MTLRKFIKKLMESGADLDTEVWMSLNDGDDCSEVKSVHTWGGGGALFIRDWKPDETKGE